MANKCFLLRYARRYLISGVVIILIGPNYWLTPDQLAIRAEEITSSDNGRLSAPSPVVSEIRRSVNKPEISSRKHQPLPSMFFNEVSSPLWFIDEIDTEGDTGLHASVVYHSAMDAIFVSYYDATNQRLRLARSDGKGPEACGQDGTWGCWTLDSGADVGKFSSIALNPKTGGIGIAYHDATNVALKYLTIPNPHLLVYQKYTIDRGIQGVSTTGLYPSLKYNEDGIPFIAYYFENPSPGGADALILAYHSSASGNCLTGDLPDEWRCETIITGEGVGMFPSLAIVDGWEFHVAYYDRGNGDLWYATSVGEGNCGSYGTDWVCYPVTGAGSDVGKYASLFVDSSSNFHIAYYDVTNKKLMYAVKLSGAGGNCGVLGSAQCDEIDTMPADYHPLGISMVQDLDGYPMIAYQAATGSLNLARPLAALGLPVGAGNCGPGTLFNMWFCKTMDLHGTWINYRNGDFISLSLSPSGMAQIAYNGFITAQGGNLRVMYQRYQNHLPVVMKNH